jgi:SAM-dependent methyltransferase
MSYNRYQNTAMLYDLDQRDIVKADIPFYLALADRTRGDILELACGTGRVTIPLLQAGHRVWGLDYSSRMLERLSQKSKSCTSEEQARLTVIEADMCDYRLPNRYPLIILPFRSFQLLTEPEQPLKCLQRVYEHLADDGLFLLHLFRPYDKLDESWVCEEREDWTVTDPETGIQVRRTQIRGRIDIARQIIYPTHTYYVNYKDGTREIHAEELAMRYYYEAQIRELLAEAKLRIVEEYGYFDYRPIREGTEMLFVCKKVLE